MKKKVSISALRAANTARVVAKLRAAYPQFVPAASFLETSFGNIGEIFHPTITLMNRDRIREKAPFDFYTDGVTRKVAHFIKQVDNEVQEVANALGTKRLSVTAWLRSRYGLKVSDIYTMIRSNRTYQGIKAPTTLNNRYLWEDIPTGLVSISSFGNAVGVPTKAIDTLIEQGCSVLNRDFREEGRTYKKLGLSRKTLIPDLRNIIGPKRATA